MASYTKISLEEAQEILKLYGIPQVKELTPLSLGISNSNYRVYTGERNLLLKISNDKNITQLTEEQRILKYLSNHHYPYSICSLQLTNGDMVYQYKNYYGVVFPFIEGIPPGPSDLTCHEIGSALATLHSLKHDSFQLGQLRKHEEVGYGPQEILHYVNSQNCPDDFKEAFELFFPDKLERFFHAHFEKGVIHGDLYYDNTLFDQNHLKVVLDFEQAGIGEYIFDLGISISGTCLEKSRVILPLVESFITGYEKVRPLPKKEREFLYDSIILGFLSISLWRIKRFKEGQLNPLMENSYRDLLYKAHHFHQLVQDQD